MATVVYNKSGGAVVAFFMEELPAASLSRILNSDREYAGSVPVLSTFDPEHPYTYEDGTLVKQPIPEVTVRQVEN